MAWRSIFLLAGLLVYPSANLLAESARHAVGLTVQPAEIRLSVATQIHRFTKEGSTWAFDAVEVDNKAVARPLSRNDSFVLGGGQAEGFEVLTDDSTRKSICFRLQGAVVTYTVDAGDQLPLVRVAVSGLSTPTVALRTAGADAKEHGAWVTRGWVATDADGHEAFIDASNPLVFGHSLTGDCDCGYLFLPAVNPHIQKNGRSEQRTDTWFQSRRIEAGDGRFAGSWQLRMGCEEPKEFGMLFDRDLGGRLSDVCEKYFADAVETLVDVTAVPASDYDAEKCMEVMPVRLASPDAFIPGWGWMMSEFPKAAYPFAHDSVWQQPALLAFEGLATGRPWECNFARYLLDKTPLEGPDGESYFVRRPGGLTRWGYFATYRDHFPHLDGGTWWHADVLYRTAQALDDDGLRKAALDMVLHDLNVKLDLEKMEYPPCWSAIENRVGRDHRDDWFKTPGLAYCAYMASRVAYPETGDMVYLAKADRICEWFAGYLVPEVKLNFLQGTNMHAVFSHYLVLAFLDEYGRSRDRRFLDMARDMAWVHIMTTCTTPARDTWGHPLTGTTCVGVRDCVDYDCAPNLCHEKDLTFVHIIGPLLDYVSGPAYAKYLTLHRMVLAKDSWKSAWVAELRDTNLRTMYDTYARGMANLVYALNGSSDPWVIPVEKLVSKSDADIAERRDTILANGTSQDRRTNLQVRFLTPGTYSLSIDDKEVGNRSHTELASGISVDVPANCTRRIGLHAVAREKTAHPDRQYDQSMTYLSDLTPFAAQRGTGLPEPTYATDRSLSGSAITLGDRIFAKGIGCAANTVLVYQLSGNYERFRAVVGVDHEVAGRDNPAPSVFFTVHVDGLLHFESGPMYAGTAPRDVDVDVRNARMLILRVSGNWDDGGDTRNDRGDWANACLVGRARP